MHNTASQKYKCVYQCSSLSYQAMKLVVRLPACEKIERYIWAEDYSCTYAQIQ